MTIHTEKILIKINRKIKLIVEKNEYPKLISFKIFDFNYLMAENLFSKILQKSSSKVIEHVIKNGIKLESKNTLGQKPIHIACKYSHKAVKLLLERGVHLGKRTNNNKHPIQLAIQFNNYKLIKLLIDVGVNIELSDNEGYRLIHFACRFTNLKTIKLLLKNNIDINSKNNKNQSPLHLACMYGRVEIVKCLLENGANVHCKDDYDYMPIHYVCFYRCASNQSNYDEILKLLINKGTDVNSISKDYYTQPLHDACNIGKISVAKILLEHGANIESISSDNWRPIHYASRSSYEMVKLLFDKGADMQTEAIDKSKPIHVACCNDEPKIVEFLMGIGVDLEEETDMRINPLDIALFNEYWDVLYVLIHGFVGDYNHCANTLTRSRVSLKKFDLKLENVIKNTSLVDLIEHKINNEKCIMMLDINYQHDVQINFSS